MYGFKFRGYWLDAGTPQAYLQSHRVLLDEQDLPVPDLGDDVNVTPPVLIGENCRLGEKAVVGPHTCLGNSIEVGGGTRITNSVLLGRTRIGRNIALDNCIVGFGCVIEDDVNVTSGTVIADNQVFKKGTTNPSGSKVGT